MQNLTILTTQNQLSKNLEQGNALSKNNEPSVSFKELLSNQPPKSSEQTNTADTSKSEAVANSNTASANNVANNKAAASEAASKQADIKNAGHTKTKTQAKGQKEADKSDEKLEIASTPTAFVDDVQALTTGTKKQSEDQGEAQPSVAAATDANAAMIASLNLPAKDFVNITSVTVGNKTGDNPQLASPALPGFKASGDEAIKKDVDLDLSGNKSATAGQFTVGDLQAKTAAMQNTSADGGFNAQLEHFGAKLAAQESTDKVLPPALNALANQSVQAISASNINAAQAAATNVINAYPGKTGWDQAISQKVVWMVGAAEQTATLTLNPPDLGPLQVVISVNNDKADTTFISQNPEVRKALENGMSNLRQLMDQAGVQLGQTNVNDGKSSDFFQQTNREQRFQQSSSNTPTDTVTTIVASPGISRVNNGLVDTFA